LGAGTHTNQIWRLFVLHHLCVARARYNRDAQPIGKDLCCVWRNHGCCGFLGYL